jgi:hypothetical protein
MGMVSIPPGRLAYVVSIFEVKSSITPVQSPANAASRNR